VIDFLADSREQLVAVEAGLLEIEKLGEDVNEEQVKRVIRALNSIKGGSSFFDLYKIGELAHQTENVLALICTRKMAPTPECIRILLCAVDRMNELLRSPATMSQTDTSEIMADLRKLRPDHRDPANISGSSGAGPRRPEPRSMRILLVEDDFACRLLLQTFLSRYGECHIAVNGKEAVDAFRLAIELGQSYDLICMDIMMPVMDGREAVRQVREMEETRGTRSTYGAKIIMTTTVEEVKEVVLCFKELCDAYLMKPIDLGQLLSQLRLCQLIK
jgi:two-component system chemotaxis response regulator CheY